MDSTPYRKVVNPNHIESASACWLTTLSTGGDGRAVGLADHCLLVKCRGAMWTWGPKALCKECTECQLSSGREGLVWMVVSDLSLLTLCRDDRWSQCPAACPLLVCSSLSCPHCKGLPLGTASALCNKLFTPRGSPAQLPSICEDAVLRIEPQASRRMLTVEQWEGRRVGWFSPAWMTSSPTTCLSLQPVWAIPLVPKSPDPSLSCDENILSDGLV